MNTDNGLLLNPIFNKWGLIDIKTDSQLFDQDPDSQIDSKPLLCHACSVQFCSVSQFHHHHVQHIRQPTVSLTSLPHLISGYDQPPPTPPELACHPYDRVLVEVDPLRPAFSMSLNNSNNAPKKKPGPKSKTSKEHHTPLKLTIKRLSVDQEPSFKVVNKNKGRTKSKGAMDDMIPDGGLGDTASHPQTPSPTPSEILRPEVFPETERERSTWENLAISFGFLAPEALNSPSREMEAGDVTLPVNGTDLPETFSDARGQEDSGTCSPGAGEPEAMLAALMGEPEEEPLVNGNAACEENGQQEQEQEGSDSGYEREGSEKDFLGLDKADSTPTSTPPPNSPAPSLVGSLTVLAPSSVNSSVSSTGTPSPSPPPVPPASPGPPRPSLTLKSPASLMAPQGLGGAVSLLNIPPQPPPANFLGSQSNFMMETCEVCGDRSGDIEAHRASAGHYKCHMSPDCAVVLFSSSQELRTHQQVTHGVTPPPPSQPSLEQLQQQVQRLPVSFSMPVGGPTAVGTPPPAPPAAPISPGFRVPGGITLIQARPFAMQTSPSTIRPDGSPVAPLPTPPQTQSPGPPSLPPGLSRSISISPAVTARPTQKRASSPPAKDEAKKKRSDSPDCELVGVEKLPALPSGISLTVRPNNNKDTSGVSAILASRGISVTPAAKSSPPARAAPAPSPLTTLNLSSAVSIVPASQSRSQFAVPQGRSRQATVTSRTPTVDLTTTPDPPARRRAQRFTCQVCDKVFTTQETLNQHLTTHRSPSKLPYKCTMCNAQYPTHHALVQHKNAYHKEAQGSEMAMPVIDMRNSATVQKLSSLGVRHCIVISQLTNPSGGLFGIPIVAMDNARNPHVCNLGALGASNVLSLGPAKSLR